MTFVIGTDPSTMVSMPALRGVIDRRILLNWRIDPDALEPILPGPFRPRTVDGVAIGGVCCIRLRDVRPEGLPSFLGFASENAAHRIGVEFPAAHAPTDVDLSTGDGNDAAGGGGVTDATASDDVVATGSDDAWRPGVYIPRRDTSSRLTVLVGDRTVGRHGHATFDVREGDGRYEFSIEGDTAAISFAAREADALPADSVFEDVAAAAGYHQCGTVGYSPAPGGERYDCMELTVDDWAVTPLAVERAHASFFEERLPADAFELDNALVMKDVGNRVRRHSPIEACPATAPYPEAGVDLAESDAAASASYSSKGSSGS